MLLLKGGVGLRINRVKFVTEITRKDITLKALSEKSGVSRQTLSYIKSGKNCSETIGHKIADALEIDIKKLMDN